MAKKKLERFAELATFNNVLQPALNEVEEGYSLKGKWAGDFFRNKNPIVLELGCGKGEYTIGLAERNPGKNFIGIDIKGSRIWRGSKTAIEKDLQNVAFLRTYIDKISFLFDKDEVSEIWITFPDPQPKKNRMKKRLTSPRFLEMYKNILQTGGSVHLKTDNVPLFDYTLEIIVDYKCKLKRMTHDLYNSDNINDILSIRTFYEQMFLAEGSVICYLEFEFEDDEVKC